MAGYNVYIRLRAVFLVSITPVSIALALLSFSCLLIISRKIGHNDYSGIELHPVHW